MKPTIGRVVWYFHNRTARPQVALIAAVWGDTCINIVLFKHNGNPVIDPPVSVPLLAPGAEHPEYGFFCAWMPYEAAKSERDARLNKIENSIACLEEGCVQDLWGAINSLRSENEELRKLLPSTTSAVDPSKPAEEPVTAELSLSLEKVNLLFANGLLMKVTDRD